MAVFGKEILATIWGKCPTIVKWYLGVFVIPNLLVFLVIFYVWIYPAIRSDVHADIQSLNEMQNRRIEHILEVQKVHNTNMSSAINRFEQHQSLMYQALLNQRK